MRYSGLEPGFKAYQKSLFFTALLLRGAVWGWYAPLCSLHLPATLSERVFLCTYLIFIKMASCEKCWGDAYLMSRSNPMKSQTECYQELISTRTCTPEEAAGEDATMCDNCKRKTMHQYAKVCTNCGCRAT